MVRETRVGEVGAVEGQPGERPPLRNLADVQAVESVPLEQRLAAATTYDLIRRSADAHPDAPALIWLPNGRADDAPVEFTYRAFFNRVTQAANLLARHGVEVGRPVSCLLPNLPQTHFVLWGGAAVGGANPVNPLLAPPQIAEIIRAAGSRVLVTT